MKPISKLIIFVLTCLTLAASAFAQEPSPREQFQTAVAAYQKAANSETALKVIELFKQIDPPPAVTEEARRHFVMGATVLKESTDAAGAKKALDLFTQSVHLAPWWAEARYNCVLAREASGDFNGAIAELKIYLVFSLADTERREAQDKIYALEAKTQLAAERKTEEDKVATAKKVEEDKVAHAAAEKRQAEQARRDVFTKIKNAVNGRSYVSDELSYNDTVRYAGVNEHELFGGGQYYLFTVHTSMFWKYFDERVELWGDNHDGSKSLVLLGESWGPKITDMRWFVGKGDNTKSETQQVWVYVNLENGCLYAASVGGRPLNASEFDPKKRYRYYRYAPAK